MNQEIKTPHTHPDHPVVGHLFIGWPGGLYYCDSYDPRIGYWMTPIKSGQERRNVSERAIGRTYHEQYPLLSGWNGLVRCRTCFLGDSGEQSRAAPMFSEGLPRQERYAAFCASLETYASEEAGKVLKSIPFWSILPGDLPEDFELVQGCTDKPDKIVVLAGQSLFRVMVYPSNHHPAENAVYLSSRTPADQVKEKIEQHVRENYPQGATWELIEELYVWNQANPDLGWW